METLFIAPTTFTIGTPSQYRAYALHNYRQLSQIQRLSEEERFAIDVVARVFPFKTNSYVVDELIDWESAPNDPLFLLNFPHRDMLRPDHFDTMANLLRRNAPETEIRTVANRIRMALNPHPAGQMEANVPSLEGEKLRGVQHKYRETVLFFPSQGQTCHAYCTFCFRWPQFVGVGDFKFAMREKALLFEYLQQHTEVTDLLITGGDPLVMRASVLADYLLPLLEKRFSHIRTIRLGSKALAYWPYRFLTDDDAGYLLALFGQLHQAGKHVTLMAHFNHPRELKTAAAREAIERICQSGVQIRTQSPLLAHINDQADLWRDMWRQQVVLGCVPYYMFVVRDTGAQHFFGVPLARAWEIFRQAYQGVSGLGRSVQGPCMSTYPGKIQVLGVNEIRGERVLSLRFVQGRNPDWVLRPFFARYDPRAAWLHELKPAFGEEKFFFEE
ncbi:MAG: KamA family radical SAM protein [Chloroflexota bacterium]